MLDFEGEKKVPEIENAAQISVKQQHIVTTSVDYRT
jgi:hypothetical protein